MAEKIRWGILSTGGIAHTLARAIAEFPDEAEIVAVGSRTKAAAESFGEEFSVPHRHGSYRALCEDPDVDIVYVATPHIFHHRDSMMALENGKHVLCEKAFTINAPEAREMIRFARRHELFLMEAMWARFAPANVRVRELLAEGVLGDVRMVHADMGFWVEPTPENKKKRLLNPELGGGGLLDVGIYPISYVSMILGAPLHTKSFADIGETNVDGQAAMIFQYDDGRLASITCGVQTHTPGDCLIAGTKGQLTVHAPIFAPKKLTLSLHGKDAQVIDMPFECSGYAFEVAHVHGCLRSRLTESPVMSLDETLSIMKTLDGLRRQWGFKYPTESAPGRPRR